MKQGSLWTSYLPVIATVIAGLLLTCVGFFILLEVERQQIRTEFDGAAKNRIMAIQKVLDLRIVLLKAIRAVFFVSHDVSREEFHKLVAPVLSRPNMASALVWLPRVHDNERVAFEARSVDGEKGDFAIRDPDGEGRTAPAARREVYYPVLFAEPREVHRAVLGIDLGAQPGLLQAMLAACDIGDAARTPCGPLRTWGASATGFHLFLPVFREYLLEENVERRRAEHTGFIGGVFRLDELVTASFESMSPQGLDFQILDPEAEDGSAMQYAFTHLEEDEPGFLIAPVERGWVEDLVLEQELAVGESALKIRCKPTLAFVEDLRTWYPLGVFPIGLLLTGLIGGTLFSLRGRAEKIQRLVEERTADLVEANERLKATQLQLIQAEKMESVGRLAAGVAHEVKNPLAIIQLGLDYLKKAIREKEDQIEVVEELDEAVGRADTVVKGLMDFARTHKLEMERLDPNRVMEDALRMVRHDLTRHKVTLERDLAGDLPRVEMDRNKIQQVLLNLFMNAIQAMEGAGTLTVRSARIQAKADRTGAGEPETVPCVRLTVEDTGPGIPEESLSKIFDPFYTTKAPGQGTGLGLSVSRNIIELHKGKLEMQNKAGEGASFTMTFPIQGES